MLRSRVSLVALVASTAILASACSDTTQPNTPAEQSSSSPGLRTAQQPAAADPNALASSVPGFGGFFLDEQGTPTIYLKDAAQRGNAGRALAAWLQARGLDPSGIRVLKGDFDWADLERWQAQASEQVLGAAGAVFVDADEASNRVRIGVERGAAGAEARAAAARLGIPASAVIVQETDPIQLVTTLQDHVRPILAGLQINFPGFLCTLGFNAVDVASGQNSFVTASHCTSTQGGVENTPYWQPLQSVDPDTIGIEVADPPYLRNIPGCPKGRRCRKSDAARARYLSGVTFTLGGIEATSGPNPDSLRISGAFSISDTASAVVGDVVNKVGRSSGWTQGKVTNTCVNTGVSGTNIVQLCQTFVSAGVKAGDSGSDVFAIIAGGSNVNLLGILWGGNSSGTQFVYSPMFNIESELGALRVH